MPPRDGSPGDPLAPHSLSATELQALIATAQGGEPFLALRPPGGPLDLVSLARLERITVGRSPQADLSLAWDPEVSGVHAELEPLVGEWTIVDDGLSRNGTFVNGIRISRRLRLRDGDRIRLGQTVLAYVFERAGERSETLAAVDVPERAPLTETQRRVLIALCRPYRDGTSFATPASNQEIAAEVFLGVDAVKAHLRTLFARFELTELPQNQKRARLAEVALHAGVISLSDLAD
jgi:pSer/pThr/pTyr-binding forkhead associated (FHA) protein